MKYYLCQQRELAGWTKNHKPRYEEWKTDHAEPADEVGGARAEKWLKGPMKDIHGQSVALDQRRIKLGDWILTRQEALDGARGGISV